MMKIVKTVKEMQSLADELRKEKRIGFVPTMGFLHEGHLALARRARELGDIVVVSIFVNPIQFGPAEDLSKYPRDFDRDAALLDKEKTDIIFFPEAGGVYPESYSAYVEVKGLTDFLCGKTRTGHFLGVTTVVNKLFNIVKPHFAVFGQKDYQQLKVIEKMVRDLNMDVEIVPYPTVREKDGLAMSSRNTYLSPEERERALLISKSLKAAEEQFRRGERKAQLIRDEVKRILCAKEGIDIEYISVAHAGTLEEFEEIPPGKALLAIACRIGKTRLIDNTILTEA